MIHELWNDFQTTEPEAPLSKHVIAKWVYWTENFVVLLQEKKGLGVFFFRVLYHASQKTKKKTL